MSADSSNVVTSGELLVCVHIAAGDRPLSDCPQCDCDEDTTVSQAEKTRVSNNFTGACDPNECPPPTATPGTPVTNTPIGTAGVPTPSRTPTLAQPTATTSPSGTPANDLTPTVTPGLCVGDCDGNHRVLVNELVIGVNIALERAAVTMCSSFDENQSSSVSVNELVQGVNNLLKGCPGTN